MTNREQALDLGFETCDLGVQDHADGRSLRDGGGKAQPATISISGRKVDAGQSCLLGEFNEDLRLNVPGCRTWIGDFFEAATAAITGGVRLKTDCSADICPDIKISDRLYIESKSVGINGSLIIFNSDRRPADQSPLSHR